MGFELLTAARCGGGPIEQAAIVEYSQTSLSLRISFYYKKPVHSLMLAASLVKVFLGTCESEALSVCKDHDFEMLSRTVPLNSK